MLRFTKNFLLTFLFAVTIGSCATLDTPEQANYYVKANCSAVKNCFTSVQSAIDASQSAPKNEWVKIKIGPGNYYEKVTISRNKTEIAGAGAHRVRLHFNEVAQTAGRYHRNNWGTAGSATLTINADLIKISGLKIENTYDYLANDALAPNDPKRIGNSQALAVLLDINSDRVSFDNVILLGYQDTIFANGKRAHINNSKIAGNVDFIFGNGQVLIENSEIQTRNRSAKLEIGEFHSFIAAPSTPISQNIGLVFYRNRLTREIGVPDNSVALARPWHPTTTFPDGRYADPNAIGQAVFIDCFMGKHINEKHWTSMNGTARDGTKTAIFKPEDSRFFEIGSRGPGAIKVYIGIKWRERVKIESVRTSIFENWPQLAPERK